MKTETVETDYSALFPAAFTLAHLALAMAANRARPAALIFFLGLAVRLGALPRYLAHLALAAAAILARAAGLSWRRPLWPEETAAIRADPFSFRTWLISSRRDCS